MQAVLVLAQLDRIRRACCPCRFCASGRDSRESTRALAEIERIARLTFRELVNGRGMGVSKVTHMPEDAKEAFGHGIRAKRSSTGSMWRPIANHAPDQ
jgi:hypothetical protein